jgi:hypothetical protein
LDDKISDTQQQAFSIHWLTVMAKETSKPTEEAVTEIDHSLAIAQNENRHNWRVSRKSTIVWRLRNPKQPSLLAKVKITRLWNQSLPRLK